MLHEAFGDDLVGVMDARLRLHSEREGERRGKTDGSIGLRLSASQSLLWPPRFYRTTSFTAHGHAVASACRTRGPRIP
jgi:hypothetical protein